MQPARNCGMLEPTGRHPGSAQQDMKNKAIGTGISIKALETLEELRQVQAIEKKVWELSDEDTMPLTLMIALKAAGGVWVGAFESNKLVGFAFGFLGREGNNEVIHSHMLAVLGPYRDTDVGYRLKLAQRERSLAMGIHNMTWTFDPLQSKNAHFNFAKLGVVCDQYKEDFYGPETSSVLHRNGTDRLWVQWRLDCMRVQTRLRNPDNRTGLLEIIANVPPLIQFNGTGRPLRADLATALARQRVAIEIPADINAVEQKDAALAREWRQATRWAFTHSLQAGFFVAEFCRAIRGQQGPGAYILEKGTVADFIREF
jgi:predicted GNAT superfamily acetyltransferase